jgi:hypothetical protein
MIETSLKSLERLQVVSNEIGELEWAHRFLLLAYELSKGVELAKSAPPLRKLMSKGVKPLRPQILILTGYIDPGQSKEMDRYKKVIRNSLSGFRGTVITAAVKSSAGLIVRDVKSYAHSKLKTMAYVPSTFRGLNLTSYHRIRYSDGREFSFLELLQTWIDIICEGIPVSDVRVIGFGMGENIVVECALAIALGARVAVLGRSSDELDKMLSDRDWKDCERLISLPMDEVSIEKFLGLTKALTLSDVREALARAIHEDYNRRLIKNSGSKPVAWDQLSSDLKDSNFHQADHIIRKLRGLGYDVRGYSGSELVKFEDNEVEMMAEMEHGRWCMERFNAGWKYGPRKDEKKKISPDLIPWSSLSEKAKDKDRSTVRNIPTLLEGVGMEVYRAK